ncbi:MAG: glycerophosphodiester phosphodiesterase [Actinomycetota bacterium]|nr:glycerophosphodiester phosphodiesterase [Actinomycetota bacterium]
MISLERRDGRPLVIGHRGAAALAPENTLASFRAALAAGVDLIEFDVLSLHDGELAIAHSDDLHEVSHGAARGTIGSMTLGDLREIAPDVPTLDEVLAFFADEAPEVGVHVDLKSASALEGVAHALARFDLLGRSLVSSFHHAALRRLARLEPRVRTGASFPEDRLGISRRPRSGPVVSQGLRSLLPLTPLLVRPLLARSRATVLVLKHELVSPRTVGRAHARGASVIAWTVDEPVHFSRVVTAGVDAVVTNDPSRFVSTLKT